MPQESKSSTIYYGWFVVAGCFAATLTLGEAMWTFGIFFKPLGKEFGWSRALVSSGYTAFLIGYGISTMMSGRLVDRYNPRPILFVSALLAGLGVSLCSQVQSITQLRLFLLIGGLGAGATWSVPTSTVQRWFYQRPRAGLALGIVVSGVGAGGLIFAPIINYLILGYGWRNAYLIVGIMFFSIITISSLLVKDAPSITRESSTKNVGDESNRSRTQGWTTARVLATPSFAGITFAHCAVALTFQIITVHLVPRATDIGISPTTSALALGLLGGCSIPGRILSGFLADRLGWQKILTLSMFGLALSILLITFLSGPWMLFAFVVFYGVFHGCRVSAYVGILGEFFGMRSLGELIGITMSLGMVLGAFSPYIAGFIFDVTGSYLVAFMITIAFLLTGGVIAHVIKKPDCAISNAK